MKTPSLCTSLGAALLFVLTGCASPQEAQYQKTASVVHALPLYEQGPYVRKLYAGGIITQSQYNQLMATWESDKKKVEAEADKVAGMTSNQRAAYLYAQHQAQTVKANQQLYASEENQVSVVKSQQHQKNAAYTASHPAIPASSQVNTPVPYTTTPPTVAPSGPVIQSGY